MTYGSFAQPTALGSGGANAPLETPGGGGSGGSLWLECEVLTGSGGIRANGGKAFGGVNVIGATPFEPQYLIYSLTGLGSKFIPPINLDLKLIDTRLYDSATASAGGTASRTAALPASAQGALVWIQVAEFENVSNVEFQVVQ